MIFDLDGTLGNTLPAVIQAFQETFLRFGGRQYAPDEILAMFGPSEEGVIRSRVSPEAYSAALNSFIQRYTELHRESPAPFDGVLAMMQRLQALGLHMAVVTGKGPGTAGPAVSVMGLAPFIEAIIPGSANGAEKPKALFGLLEGWGLRPEEAAYVGDMAYDMRAAREAGVIPLGAAWAETATVGEGDGAEKLFYCVEDLVAWVEARTG